MSRRVDLTETPQTRLARLLQAQDARLGRLETRPTGVKHLGDDGDVVWNGPGWQADPEGGPPIPTLNFQTWSVKDLARETATSRLAAEGAVTSANGKNARIYSLEPAFGQHNPSTGGLLVEGDTWWQYADDDGTYSIVGSWVWAGGQWTAETLTDAVLGALDVNKLVVLGTADINELVAQAIAAKIIEAELFRTPVDPTTGFWAVMDSFGFRVINEYGPEGDAVDVIRLGPDAAQWLQIGTPETGQATIDSAGGVTGVHGSFETLFVDGRRVGEDSHTRPRGEIAAAAMVGGSSRKLNGRGVVLGLDTMLDPGRRYLLQTNSPVVHNEKAECEPQLELQVTMDGSAPESNWEANRRAESSIGWYPNWRNHPPLHHRIDLRHLPVGGPPVRLRAALSLGNRASNGWCMVAAPIQPLLMWIDDVGTSSQDRGYPFFDSGGGGERPPRQQHTRRWTPTGWATYIRGGSREYGADLKPTQGQWSEWNRSCYFFFDDLTGVLAGALIQRITLFAWADHWAGPTGTGRWHWHGMFGQIPESGQTSTFMVDTPGWPRGSARTIDIIPEEFGLWQNGQARGFGFTSIDTGHEYYGQFSPFLGAHFIEIQYLA